jgi:hypothetical protein
MAVNGDFTWPPPRGKPMAARGENPMAAVTRRPARGSSCGSEVADGSIGHAAACGSDDYGRLPLRRWPARSPSVPRCAHGRPVGEELERAGNL